jgi:hypothetical protein
MQAKVRICLLYQRSLHQGSRIQNEKISITHVKSIEKIRLVVESELCEFKSVC